jgi:DNA-binding transcriptional MerR regulator
MTAEMTLAELADASELQPRTIRSWVAQGLLPGPSRGAAARYPAETLERVLAIRAMRDVLRRPLAEIRQELLVVTPEELRALAAKARGLAPEPAAAAAGEPSSALDYVRALRARSAPGVPQAPAAPPPAAPPTGFEALERRLGGTVPPRKARGEDWLRVAITPDVELAVRGPLDDAARARLERCADLIRNILLGSDR